MRIIITVEDFNSDKGYLEYYLAKELAHRDNKIIVVSYNSKKSFYRKMLEKNLEVIYIPYVLRINGIHFLSIRSVSYVINLIRKERPEIIHCQPLFSPLSLLFISLKYFWDYKIVGSLISQLPTHWNNITKKVLFSFTKISIALIKKNIEIVFVKTKELGEIISHSYNIAYNKICIIPLGADENLFKFDPEARTLLRKEINLSETDIVIVYSGMIIPSKDLDILIKAVAPIITNNNQVKLLIIGEGESSHVYYLKLLADDLSISTNIIFHPWVHRTILPALYSASDIGVWPGRSSISIIEAASIGLPLVIASSPIESYGIRYKNGFEFEQGNIEELRRCLETLISEERLRKEMGCRSRQLVENELNWKTVTNRYLHAYTFALNSCICKNK